jgi:hypothetical protein
VAFDELVTCIRRVLMFALDKIIHINYMKICIWEATWNVTDAQFHLLSYWPTGK